MSVWGWIAVVAYWLLCLVVGALCIAILSSASRHPR